MNYSSSTELVSSSGNTSDFYVGSADKGEGQMGGEQPIVTPPHGFYRSFFLFLL
jgi:hypothetical protein